MNTHVLLRRLDRKLRTQKGVEGDRGLDSKFLAVNIFQQKKYLKIIWHDNKFYTVSLVSKGGLKTPHFFLHYPILAIATY